MNKKKKKIELNSEKTLERQLLEAKNIEEEEALRKKLKRELKRELKNSRRRMRELSKKVYDEREDVRTPEQIELSDKVHKEVIDFVKDKYLYSKFGNKLHPHVYWVKGKANLDENKVRESMPVTEKEVIREYVKPNNSYYTYADEKDPVPEEVILNGYKEILSEYCIDHLDEYNIRKLLYHTLLSIAHYLDINQGFYIALEDMHIFREPLKRNVFTVIIPQSSYNNKGTSVESLYQYFVGGDMDVEALQKTLDVFALSFIEYTEAKKSLRDKARESANRYRLLQELTEQAKAMLKAQGISGGKGYRKQLWALRDQLREERRQLNSKHINKKYLTSSEEDLTNEKSCDIIEENEESTTQEN